MLNYQDKQNEAGESTEFLNNEHDAAEFNSMSKELKNAVTEFGGVLTELPDYASESIYKLATAIIAGGGYIYVPTTQSANSIEITQAGASSNSLPTLLEITNKLVTYIASDSNTSTTVNVQWGGGADINIINTDGSLLRVSQIKADSKVSIVFNGVKWVLVGNDKDFIINAEGNIAYGGAPFPEAPVPELNSMFWLNDYSECRFSGSLYQCTGCYLTTGGINYRATVTGKITVTVINKNGINKNYNIDAVSGNDYPLTSMSDSPLNLKDYAVKCENGEEVVFVCYGDSVIDGQQTTSWIANPTDGGGDAIGTTNHNLTAPNAFPIKLDAILKEAYENANIYVYNCGYTGKRMDDGWSLANYDNAINYPETTHGKKPGVAFIGFGLNDISDASFDIDLHISELDKLVQKLRTEGTTSVILATDAISRNEDLYLRGGREASMLVNEARDAYCTKNNLDFIDMDTELKNWFSVNKDDYRWLTEQSDALHLEDNGHAFKAGVIFKEIYRDVVFVDGDTVNVNSWDSRANADNLGDANVYTLSNNLQGGNYNWSSLAPTDSVMMRLWVWNINPNTRLDYLGIDNDRSDEAVATDQPSVKATNLIDGAIAEKNLISGGFDFGFYSAYRRSDETFTHSYIKYGLSKIEYISGTSSSLYFGGFRFVPMDKPSYPAVREMFVNALNGDIFTARFAASTGIKAVLFNDKEGSGKFDIGPYNDEMVEFHIDYNFPKDSGIILLHGQGFNGSQAAVDNDERAYSLVYRNSVDDLVLYNGSLNKNGDVTFLSTGHTISGLSWPIGGGVDGTRISFTQERYYDGGWRQRIRLYGEYEGDLGTALGEFIMFGPTSPSVRWAGTVGGVFMNTDDAAVDMFPVVKHFTAFIPK